MLIQFLYRNMRLLQFSGIRFSQRHGSKTLYETLDLNVTLTKFNRFDSQTLKHALRTHFYERK